MRIELYYSYIAEDAYPSLERWLAAFPPPRQAQIAARQTPAARAESIAVTHLLQQALAAWENPQPDQNEGAVFGNKGVYFCEMENDAPASPLSDWEIAEGGRPFPHGLHTTAGRVWVSLSHSAGHLLVALADRPMGADIQWLGAAALSSDRWRRLDDRIRHPEETTAADAAEVALRFAAKEAAVKLTGEGLSGSLCRLRLQNGTVWYPNGQQATVFSLIHNGCAVAVSVADATR